ncbi:trimeric intracellular cation channel family protein [Streptomyces sp. NPDC059740]|uniref:trimeric intracellular cation channel family protein n=1 Tax=Streptomyces sp. NPDC059740 TaxID=3346926 RepID=UPI003659E39B
MSASQPLLELVLDLTGTFTFALDGALTAMRVARLDIVGVLTLAMITALGGGMIRDVLIGSVPPATFSDWRYLAVALGGGLVAFLLGRTLERFARVITLLDAAGLSLFAVTGAVKALAHGLGPAQAVLLGAVSAVGGGTLRDVLVGRVPTVLRADLYAVPALVASAVTVVCARTDTYGLPAALAAAFACFALRMTGVHYGLNAPGPRRGRPRDAEVDAEL